VDRDGYARSAREWKAWAWRGVIEEVSAARTKRINAFPSCGRKNEVEQSAESVKIVDILPAHVGSATLGHCVSRAAYPHSVADAESPNSFFAPDCCISQGGVTKTCSPEPAIECEGAFSYRESAALNTPTSLTGGALPERIFPAWISHGETSSPASTFRVRFTSSRIAMILTELTAPRISRNRWLTCPFLANLL
jgi:hypothetical protein